MPELHQSAASLRIVGDSLVPDEITAQLGCEPTSSGAKGEVVPARANRRERKMRSGAWMLNAEDASPGNIDGQAMEILGKLTQDLEVWRSLSSQFKIDLFCGLFMKVGDEGFELSADTMSELGSRGIKLDLCLYGPIREDIE